MRTKAELCENLGDLRRDIEAFDFEHTTQSEMNGFFYRWSRTLDQIVLESSQVPGVEAPYIELKASDASRHLREALVVGSEDRERKIFKSTVSIDCIRNNIEMLGQQ